MEEKVRTISYILIAGAVLLYVLTISIDYGFKKASQNKTVEKAPELDEQTRFQAFPLANGDTLIWEETWTRHKTLWIKGRQ